MPRSFKHWTLRYLFDRSMEKIYRWINPDLSWLTPQANQLLRMLIKPDSVGVEFGSGHSTLWFARHAGHLTSVEHNPAWYARVSEWLSKNQISNVDYLLRERQLGDDPEGFNSIYVQVATNFAPVSLDFALVDGIFRSATALALVEKIKPGGMLIVDNANLHLPSGSHSPNSLSLQQGAATPTWNQFLNTVSSWKAVWTSNGVSDTVFFFR